MGAPFANIKTLVARLSKKVSNIAFGNSVLFIMPSLAIMMASLILFYSLKELDTYQLNTLAVIIMVSLILSLVATAGIQFTIYKIVGEASISQEQMTLKNTIRKVIMLGIISITALSIIVIGCVYPYFKYILGLSILQFWCFGILFILFSIIWVLIAVSWASGQYKYPALVFAASSCSIFFLSNLLYYTNPEYIIYGYIAGIVIIVTLLSICTWITFRGGQRSKNVLKALPKIPKLVFNNYWGMLFQTFFVVAIFLDKICVWMTDGGKTGSGLQIIGSYTTGAFIGLMPIFSLGALVYFTERIKPLTKDMYDGTLGDIRRRVDEYKRLYMKGFFSMLAVGLIILIIVVSLSAYFIEDETINRIVLTIATGVLFFEIILYDAFVLPVFNRSYISTISVIIVCFGEVLATLFVSNSVWYASVGFLGGSFIGSIISHSSTTRLLSKFDYNAFRAFQTMT